VANAAHGRLRHAHQGRQDERDRIFLLAAASGTGKEVPPRKPCPLVTRPSARAGPFCVRSRRLRRRSRRTWSRASSFGQRSRGSFQFTGAFRPLTLGAFGAPGVRTVGSSERARVSLPRRTQAGKLPCRRASRCALIQRSGRLGDPRRTSPPSSAATTVGRFSSRKEGGFRKGRLPRTPTISRLSRPLRGGTSRRSAKSRPKYKINLLADRFLPSLLNAHQRRRTSPPSTCLELLRRQTTWRGNVREAAANVHQSRWFASASALARNEA